MLRQPSTMEVLVVMNQNKKPERSAHQDKQPDRKEMPTSFDHEFANEPLTTKEKFNNKKTKKRQ